MPITYDFDIHFIMPRDVFADEELGKMLGEIGMNVNARGNYVALFRNPETVTALQGADDVVKQYLEASGFGWNTFDSGAPSGTYPADVEPQYIDVISRLTENLERFKLKGANFNGFEFSEFLMHIARVHPIDMTTAPKSVSTKMPGRRTPKVSLGWPQLLLAAGVVVVALSIGAGLSQSQSDEVMQTELAAD